MAIKKIIRHIVPYQVRLLLNPLRKFLLHPGYRQRALYTKARAKAPVDNHMIFYEAYHGRSMTGNPYAVFTYLLRNPDFQHFTHVWAVVDETVVPRHFKNHPNVSIIRYQSREYAKYLATAKYLINDTSFPFYFHKREEQVYANIWHGTPLKTMGMDIKQRKFADHKNIQRNFLFADYFVSPNQYTYEKLLRSHDVETIFNGQILDTGYPRVDLMFNANQTKVRERLGVPSGKKIMLYAPTWRGRLNEEENESKKLLQDLGKLQKHTDEDTVVLLKSHYYTRKFFKGQGMEHLLVPEELDTNELLAVVDVLITDYSSIFFEFLPTKRPVIFYAYDESDYQTTRGTYIPMNELPGPLCRTVDEVIERIQDLDSVKKEYQDVYEHFLQKFCYHDDGQATARFVDTVFHGKPSEHLFKIETDKTKILIYGGGFLNNGITAAAISLLNTIDFDKYDVTLIDHGTHIKESKQHHMQKVDPRVHHIFRFGTWNATLTDLYRHVFFLKTGSQTLAPVTMYEQEFERMTGLTEFDIGIDFGGYSPFWAALFAFGNFKRKSIYLHSDMEQEVGKKVKNRYPHRQNLKVIFSLYDRFDKVISVSKLAHEENRKNLSQHVSDYRKMDYVVNPVDYEWILNMKNETRLRLGEGFAPQAYAAEIGKEFPEKNELRLAGKFDTEFGAETVDIARGAFLPVRPGRSSLFPLPSSKDINFITIGRLSPEKDHMKLIRAFAKIVARYPWAKLYIVGEGALETKLKHLVWELNLQKSIFFTGQLDNPYFLLNQCDCFVLSSNYEGQAIVLLEALILGKPVISTDIPGPRSVVDGGYGLLVENSVDGLAQGMTEFLSGRLIVERPFDYEAYQQKAMAMFYEKVCQLEE